MKGLTMNWIKTLLFLMIAPALTNDTERCEPFKALFIWHTSNGTDASFYQGKRLLISVINSLPQGTDVILKTIGAEANIDKQVHKDTTWKGEISLHKPGTSGNHVISSNDISEAVCKYLDQNDTPKRAEEVFLIVNDKSVIDNKGRVEEALRKKKTFVVVYGELTDVWTNLATDKNHLMELDDDNLNSTIKSLRNLSCKDSNNYIQDKDFGVTTPASDQINLKTIHKSVITNTSLLSVIIFCIVISFCYLDRKSIKKARTKLEKIFCKKGNVTISQESAQPPNTIRYTTAHQVVENDNSENKSGTEIKGRRNDLSPGALGIVDVEGSKQPPPVPYNVTSGADTATLKLLEENR